MKKFVSRLALVGTGAVVLSGSILGAFLVYEGFRYLRKKGRKKFLEQAFQEDSYGQYQDEYQKEYLEAL